MTESLSISSGADQKYSQRASSVGRLTPSVALRRTEIAMPVGTVDGDGFLFVVVHDLHAPLHVLDPLPAHAQSHGLLAKLELDDEAPLPGVSLDAGGAVDDADEPRSLIGLEQLLFEVHRYQFFAAFEICIANIVSRTYAHTGFLDTDGWSRTSISASLPP